MRGPNVEPDSDPVKMVLDAAQKMLAGFVNLFQGETLYDHKLFFGKIKCIERNYFQEHHLCNESKVTSQATSHGAAAADAGPAG